MKKLIFLILFSSIVHLSSAQLYMLPIKGNSLYFRLNNDNNYLLELDTLKQIYYKSLFINQDIFVEVGMFAIKGDSISYFSIEDSSISDNYLFLPHFIKNNTLYEKYRWMKKNKNGIKNTEEADLTRIHNFSSYNPFISDIIVIKNSYLNKQRKKSKIFKAKFLALLQTHTPSYYQLISENYVDPSELIIYNETNLKNKYGKHAVRQPYEIYRWDRNISDSAVLGMFSIILHESVHRANGMYKDKILVRPNKLFSLEKTATIPIANTLAFFKEKCPTDSIFRFDDYICDYKIASSFFDFYYLINEFSAYYHDINASYLMYNNYKTKEDSLASKIIKISIVGSSLAYYEFNLFIGGYLAYLKLYNPSIYNETIGNKSLRIAYTLINQQFKGLVLNIENDFHNDSFYQEIEKGYLLTTKRVLQQFLPELENLKTQTLAKQ